MNQRQKNALKAVLDLGLDQSIEWDISIDGEAEGILTLATYQTLGELRAAFDEEVSA